MGPPQGPTGHMGSRGIFFLKQQPTGIFRSLVDYYRPDISTPWITGSDSLTCTRAADCIARTLLTFHKNNDVRSFAASLLESTAQSRQLVGFWNTLQLLTELAQGAYPTEIRHEACVELSKWYALGFPASCRSLIAGTPVEEEHVVRVARLRSKMREGGLSWLHDQIQPQDEVETTRYLEFLAASSDGETRKLAEDLLRTLRASGNKRPN